MGPPRLTLCRELTQVCPTEAGCTDWLAPSGRGDRSASHRNTNLPPCGEPKRATKGRHVAVCQELFGFWPDSDTRAWPVLRRAIAPQVESRGTPNTCPGPTRSGEGLPGGKDPTEGVR